jgi:serine protease Do
MERPTPRLRPAARRSLAAVAAIAGLALAPSLLAESSDVVRLNQATAASTATEASIAGARSLSGAFRNVADIMRPSVVQILAVDHDPAGAAGMRGSLPPGLDPDRIPEQFRDMLPGGRGTPNPGPRRGQGTGVITTADGLVITNNHVIEGADEITVVLHDGEELPAELVGADPETDLAVLRVSHDGLVPASFGDSDGALVGDWVVALGSPFGLRQSVTAGIISALGRETVGLARFENYIQTDAAINPGNSGGPLVNLDGEVIGINSAISSAAGGNDGIGFAIPSRMVQRIVNDLAADGTVERGWLGVNIQPLDGELAATFGHHSRHGVLVSGVLDGTPAAKAGLEPGDIILSIDGRATDTPASLARTVAESEPDEAVEMELIRDGQPIVRTAVLTARPNSSATPGATATATEPEAPARLGLELAPLDEELREQAGLRAATGLFVRGVEADGPAAAAGIEPGDAILRIGGTEARSVESFKAALDEIPADKAIRLLVERQGTTRFVLVKPRG